MNKNHSIEEAQRILEQVFEKKQFRSSQKQVINSILNNENTLTVMPTGGGKSICFQIPALIFEGLTIVISPLIALMKDQVDGLKKIGIDAEYINSSLSKSERDRRYENVRNGAYKLLYVAPERFKNSEFRDAVAYREVSLLVVDEAHCVSQWGNDFRPDYAHIAQFRKSLGTPPVAAFTATATKEVRADIIDKAGLDAASVKVFNEGVYRENLHLAVTTVFGEHEKYEQIVELLDKHKGSAIIYFSLIKSLDKFSAYLSEKKIRHLSYHGKLPPKQRKDIQRKFINQNNVVMAATNAFGMGVDKPDIRLVIHAEVPDSIESYYQEIGRAGRDGKSSLCHLFYDESDLALQMQFLEWRNPDSKFLKKSLVLLEKLGERLPAYSYEDLQEELVYKNRGDHRLATVLSLLERYHYIRGEIERGTLRLTGLGDSSLFDQTFLDEKLMRDRMRLLSMVQYVNTEKCRKEYIHTYFEETQENCGVCDNCLLVVDGNRG